MKPQTPREAISRFVNRDIEILAVLTVLVLLAAIALPKYFPQFFVK